eukprot:3630978-Rhodomonas_salina.1
MEALRVKTEGFLLNGGIVWMKVIHKWAQRQHKWGQWEHKWREAGRETGGIVDEAQHTLRDQMLA